MFAGQHSDISHRKRICLEVILCLVRWNGWSGYSESRWWLGGVNCWEVQPVHWDGVGFASRPAHGVWFIPDE